MIIRLAILTDIIDGIQWWGLSATKSFIWLVILFGTTVLIQSEEWYRIYIGIYRSFRINGFRFIIWFQYALIYNMLRQF